MFAGIVFKIDDHLLWFGGMLAGILNTDAHSNWCIIWAGMLAGILFLFGFAGFDAHSNCCTLLMHIQQFMHNIDAHTAIDAHYWCTLFMHNIDALKHWTLNWFAALKHLNCCTKTLKHLLDVLLGICSSCFGLMLAAMLLILLLILLMFAAMLLMHKH